LIRLIGAFSLVLLAAAPAQAAKQPGPVSVFVHVDEQEAAKEYWTADRMRSALPGDLLLAGRDLSDGAGEVVRGTRTVIEGIAPPRSPQILGLDLGGLLPGSGSGSVYTGGGQVVPTTGRVFFTLDGTDYSCSGSSAVSGNGGLVQTAGHCVNAGPGEFASRFVFVPAYRDGQAPVGEFVAQSLHTTAQWRSEGDLNYDVGYAVVGPVNGRSLAETVGAQGVGFNLARGAVMHAFGYPAAAPHDGSKLAWCHGRVSSDPLGSSDQGMNCNMTGGSSGGPWFINYDEASGVGTLNSLNSFKYVLPLTGDKMYGPYFGSVIQELYNTAGQR
jgi:hypothetical protein